MNRLSCTVRVLPIIVGLTIGFLSISAWVIRIPSAYTPYELSMLLLPPVEDSCRAECDMESCSIPTMTGHEWITIGGSDWVKQDEEDESHPCTFVPATCGDHGHEECEIGKEEEPLSSVLVAIETLSGENLERLIKRNPRRLVWDDKRSVVHVLGCGGRVTASLRVPLEHLPSRGEG